ncbi:hypothetical protein, partial [Enterobacter sichuanensis]
EDGIRDDRGGLVGSDMCIRERSCGGCGAESGRFELTERSVLPGGAALTRPTNKLHNTSQTRASAAPPGIVQSRVALK